MAVHLCLLVVVLRHLICACYDMLSIVLLCSSVQVGNEGTSLQDAQAIMAEHQQEVLPVLDQEQRLVSVSVSCMTLQAQNASDTNKMFCLC